MGLMDFFNSIPTHMDFDGQARAENLSRIIVVLFGVVGLIWGYIIQQFSQTVYILGAGLVLATILTVPPWPLYRLKPLNWQKARPDPSEMADSKSSKKKKFLGRLKLDTLSSELKELKNEEKNLKNKIK